MIKYFYTPLSTSVADDKRSYYLCINEGNRLAQVALYRKYRSKSFAEVSGQEHIVASLKSAVEHDRLSHAYLFTGPRGIGKTSVARLLARAVNCTAVKAKPCGSCNLCLMDLAGNLDIIEIDAASNRRIDEIRDLRDKIHLAPAVGRFKVYIIDEVHMLTTEAFNALLKTLEEPPSHAIFILATTESHKVPETIVSRTQRFTFKAASVAQLTELVIKVAAAEKLTLEPEAAAVLATAAHGSFRDALSLLDQAANVAGGPITGSGVRQILGLAADNGIGELVAAMAAREPKQSLQVLDRLLADGAQAPQIIAQLVAAWRTEMLKAIPTGVNTGGNKGNLNQMVNIIETLAIASKSPWPQIALEAALVRLTSVSVTTDVAPAATPVLTPAVQAPAPTKAAAPARVTSGGSGAGAELWPKALLIIKSHNNSLFSLLQSCAIEFQDDAIVVSVRFTFWKDRIEEVKNRTILEEALDKTYGRKLRVLTQLENKSAVAAVASPAVESELVSSALEILGGEVVGG